MTKPIAIIHFKYLFLKLIAIRNIDVNNKGILNQYKIETWLKIESLTELSDKGKLSTMNRAINDRPIRKGRISSLFFSISFTASILRFIIFVFKFHLGTNFSAKHNLQFTVLEDFNCFFLILFQYFPSGNSL